jgi:hypothetical protein
VLLFSVADVAPPPCQGRVGVSELDVRSGESWGEAWSACEGGMGVPSVLINIAGLRGEQDWDTLYDVNVVSEIRTLIKRKICNYAYKLNYNISVSKENRV